MGRKWDRLVVRGRMFFTEHKRMIIVAAIVVAVLLLGIFGTKIYLMMKVVLGHDVIIRLSGDAQHLDLMHGESSNVTFRTSVVTNPFCSAACIAEVFDISRNRTLVTEQFTIGPRRPHTTTHNFIPQHLGKGQELYRFSVTCKGVDSSLCHTTTQPVTRNTILTLEHGLSPEEQQLKKILEERLATIARRTVELHGLKDKLSGLAASLDAVTPMDSERETLEALTLPDLSPTVELWDTEDYTALESEAADLTTSLDSIERTLQRINETVVSRVNTYNSILDQITETERLLDDLAAAGFPENRSEIADAIRSHNGAVLLFQERTPMPEKQNAATGVYSSIIRLDGAVSPRIEETTLRIQVESDVSAEALCQTIGVCIEHPTVEERATDETSEYLTACSELGTLHSLHDSILARETANSSTTTYTGTEWRNLTLHVALVKDQIRTDMLEEVPPNSANAALISQILEVDTPNKTAVLPEGNITHGLRLALKEGLPEKCVSPNTSLPRILPMESRPISQEAEKAEPLQFREQAPICCVLGDCKPCCTAGSCSNPPLLFVHGHAFNKDTSAEYSLDIFNSIQTSLEEEGYLNGGTISPGQEASPYGILGRADTPWSFRVSYYFDAFEEEGTYNIVHTKSENIDTYAIRLKERIDTTLHLTGQEEVIIVAHSMGGLVARRYVQVFGDDHVQELILVGTPNNGIEGNIADFCPVVGEKLECSDMQKGSLFMNKLNRVPLSVPTKVIIGRGCSMAGADGDGVVTAESAVLEQADITYIQGSCTALEPLHIALFDVRRYPGVNDAIISWIGDAS